MYFVTGISISTLAANPKDATPTSTGSGWLARPLGDQLPRRKTHAGFDAPAEPPASSSASDDSAASSMAGAKTSSTSFLRMQPEEGAKSKVKGRVAITMDVSH